MRVLVGMLRSVLLRGRHFLGSMTDAAGMDGVDVSQLSLGVWRFKEAGMLYRDI